MTLLHIYQCTSHGNVRLASQKQNRQIEGRKRMFGVESKNNKFLIISKLYILNFHCNFSNLHSANIIEYIGPIIVSECILFITLFDDLNLDFNLKRHNPSWGTSAYFPRGTSALRPHHSKCCIMIIIIMRLNYNTVSHVRARVGARVCALVCVCVCACRYNYYVHV